jgi:two-component system, sensor histidine kinase RpfC
MLMSLADFWKRGRRLLKAGAVAVDPFPSLRAMSINRLVAAGCVAYVLIATASTQVPVAEYAIPLFYLCAAGFVFANLRGFPRRLVVGRYSTITLDLVTLSVGNIAFGSTSALLYPFYLWIIVGNAFRFGVPCLAVSTIMSVAGFGTAVILSPFWSSLPILSSGLLAGLAVVPLYFGFLLLRERARNEDLDAANRSTAFILSTIGQEMRVPLSVVVGLHHELRGTGLGRRQREMVRAAGGAAEAALSELDSLLDVMRIGAGRMTVVPGTFQLTDLVIEIVELASVIAAGSGLRLSAHVIADTPAAITADRRHLRKVLLTLVGNASSIAPAGAVVLTVGRQVSDHAGLHLRFNVTVSGKGIAPSTQAQVSGAYMQGDTYILQEHRVQGLDMAAAHHLIGLLGGSIRIRGLRDQSSTIIVDVPASAVPVPARGPSELAGFAVVIVSATPADTKWFADRVRGLGAGSVMLGPPEGLDAALQTASREADRIVVFVDGRDAAALPLVQALRNEPAGRGVPLGLLHRTGGWLPLHLRRAFVTAAAPASTDAEVVAAIHILARAAKSASIVEQSTSAEQERGGGESPERMSQAARRPLHVLVAVGYATTQLLASRVMEGAGHAVTSGKDEDQVLEALAAEEFDAAIVDLDHPEVSGTEIATLIRMAGLHNLPIIGLSAGVGPDGRHPASALLQGALPKPVNPGQLLDLLDRVVRAATIGNGVAPPTGKGQDHRALQVTDIASHPLFRAGGGASVVPEALTDVAALGDGAFLNKLSLTFSDEATATIRLLAAAAAAADRVVWMAQVRVLRTQAQSIGAERLASFCDTAVRIEDKRLNTDGRILAERLSAEIARVCKTLEHLS